MLLWAVMSVPTLLCRTATVRVIPAGYVVSVLCLLVFHHCVFRSEVIITGMTLEGSFTLLRLACTCCGDIFRDFHDVRVHPVTHLLFKPAGSTRTCSTESHKSNIAMAAVCFKTMGSLELLVSNDSGFLSFSLLPFIVTP